MARRWTAILRAVFWPRPILYVLRLIAAAVAFVLLSLGLMLTLVTAWDALASQPQIATVKIQPPSQVADPAGGSVNVEVAVENTSELGSFEFEVRFDPMFILFVDVQVERFLGSSGRNVICEPPIVTERTVRFGCHTDGLTPPGPSGSGPLALLTFSPHVAGVSPLALISCELSTILGSEIAATCESGEVTNPVSHFCPIELPGLPDVRIEPESQQTYVGRDFAVNVEVVDTSELGDFEFTLLYDPAIVSLVDVQVERFLGSSGRNVGCEPPIVTERTVRFGCHSDGLTPPGPSGSGPLALVTFSANRAGVSPLALISCELSTILGELVPANCRCGSVDVGFPPVRMEKDADPMTPGVQTTNNLWLMKNGCVNPEEGKGCLRVDAYLFGAYDEDSSNDLDDIPEGLGTWEEQIKFDHKIVRVSPDPNEALLESEGRIASCTHTVLTESWILVGCTTKDDPEVPGVQLGPDPVHGGLLETILVTPLVDDLKLRVRPSKDNGVLTDIIDENCEIADIYGEPYPDTLPGGLTQECGDAHITVRMLEGDMDLDCDVDVADDQMMAFRWGAVLGDIVYDSWFDLEPFPPAQPDFDIDIKDLQYVFGRNHSTCQVPIPDSQVPQEPWQ